MNDSDWIHLCYKYSMVSHMTTQMEFAEQHKLSYHSFRYYWNKFKHSPHPLMSSVLSPYLFSKFKVGSALEKLLSFSLDLISSPQSTLPDKLFHYCDCNALIGILSNNFLFATDLKFVNDSKEYVHSIDIAKMAIYNSELFSKEDSLHSLFYNIIFDEHTDFFFSNSKRVFISCLSEDGDSLGQWRAYGNNGHGYSIGLDTSVLSTLHNVSYSANRFSTVLAKVIYDDEFLSSLVCDLFFKYLESIQFLFSQHHSDVQDSGELLSFLVGVYAGAFGQMLSSLCPLFKQSSYKEENEWRIVHTVDNTLESYGIDFFPSESSDYGIKYRPVFGVPAPYIELPLVSRKRASHFFCNNRS